MKTKIILNFIGILILFTGCRKENDNEILDEDLEEDLIEYSITFNSNEGSKVNSEKVKKDSQLSKPKDPIKEGYNFKDWYLDKEFKGNPFDFKSLITSDFILYAKWEIKTYLITFNLNGEKDSNPETQIVEHNKQVKKIVNPTREEYVFLGWYINEELKTIYNFDLKVTSNLSLYAGWKKEKISSTAIVTFHTNGGNSIPLQKIIINSTLKNKGITPVKDKYIFEAWYTDENFKNIFNFQTKIESDISLYAKWKKKQIYTITFNTNGGSPISSKNIIEEETISNENIQSTKENFNFAGWYINENLTKVFDFGTKIIANLTLYARWDKKPVYKVSFNSNGGKLIPFQEIVRGEKSRKVNPIKSGYSFTEWCTDQELTDVFDFNTTIIEDITLYAKWKRNIYKVTFNYNYTGAPKAAVKIINENDKVTSITPKSTRKDYSFVNWYKEANTINLFNFNTELIKEDITLYAKWEKNSHKVTFNYNYTGAPKATIKTINENDKVTPVIPKPTRKDYNFVNWYKEANTINLFNFNTELIKKDITLYAKWESKIYKLNVTFNYNYLGAPKSSIKTVNKKDKTTAITPNPTREGYSFVNWYKEESTANIFNFNTEIIEEDTSIYAKWKIKTYNVTFNYHDTLKKNTIEKVNHGDKAPQLSHTRKDYTFDGWYTTDVATKQTNNTKFDFDTSITKAITLHAKWTASKSGTTDDKEAPKFFIKSERLRTYTKEELKNIIKRNPILSLSGVDSKIKYGVTAYKVEFKSTYKGQDLIESALAVIPEGNLDDLNVLSYQHATILKKNKEEPTSSINTDASEGLFSVIFSSFGNVVITADYVGFGSSSNLFHPYLVKDVNNQTVSRSIYTLYEFVEKELNKKLSRNLNLMGYSQGAYNTIAFNQYIQNNPFSFADLKKTYAGGGPYNLNLIKAYIIKSETYSSPFFAAYLLKAYTSHYDRTGLYSPYKDKYINVVENMNGTKFGYEINQLLTTTTSDLYTADYIKNYDTDTYKGLNELLKSNSILSVNTDTTIKLYHGAEDEFIPKQSSIDLQNNFNSSKVTYDEIQNFGNIKSTHVNSALFFFLKVANDLNP